MKLAEEVDFDLMIKEKHKNLSSQILNSNRFGNKQNIKKILIKLTPYLLNNVTFSERYFHIYYNLYEHNNCTECDKKTKFKNFFIGYKKTCSSTCSNKSKIKKNKIKKTNIYKYGVPVSSMNNNVKKKAKQTNQKIYGGNSPSSSVEVRKKQKNTCLKKYGVENPLQSERIQNEIKEKNKIITFHDTVLKYEEKYQPLFTIDEYEGYNKFYNWKCIKCNKVFKDYLLKNHPLCPKCFPKSISKPEKELQEFCLNYFNQDELIFNDRNVIKPLELDIVIPSKKLTIEFNGNYWHSELKGKDRKYHLEKSNAAKLVGYQLIQIFEDEWVNKQDIVKSILTNKFGKTPNRVHGRKTKIITVSNSAAKTFLNDNHIQGSINGSHYGLEYNGNIVSIISIGKPRFNKNYDYELLRFCNKKNYSVVGGLSKLIKHIKQSNKLIISYADKRYSDGAGYVNIGFKLLRESNPNYFYIHPNSGYLLRESRNKYQKHKLKDILTTFNANKTEWENMQENNYDRIWDCGNIVLELI